MGVLVLSSDIKTFEGVLYWHSIAFPSFTLGGVLLIHCSFGFLSSDNGESPALRFLQSMGGLFQNSSAGKMLYTLARQILKVLEHIKYHTPRF